MAAFPNMEADNVHLTAGEAKVETGETGLVTDLGTGIDLTDFLLVAQIGVEGKYCSDLSNYLQDCLLAMPNLFHEDPKGISLCVLTRL
jgi:hypothetical protein